MYGRRFVGELDQPIDSTGWITIPVDVETYLVKINLISFKLSSVHSAATKFKVIISRDEDGDDQLVTETESNILVGKTTASTKCAVYQFGSIVPATDNNTFYIHVKLNSNTATLDRVFVSYEV